MKSGIKMTKDDLAKLKKSLSAITSKDVLVGIPASETERKDGDPITNSLIGFISEFGLPEKNIPARPWLNPGIREGKSNIEKYLKQAGQAYLHNNPEQATRALMAAGLSAQNSVKNKITVGPFAKLAPATIAARLRRGITRTDPLKDTLQFLNSVVYVLRNKK